MSTIDHPGATTTHFDTLASTATCECGGQRSRRAIRDADLRSVQCECASTDQVSIGSPSGRATLEAGVPGASLQREYERRATVRATRVRREHPRLGGLILALTDEPKSTTSFRIGASGERRAAETVSKRSGSEVEFLYNRSLGRGRRDGDIDLLAVGPAGVYVVDVKCYPQAQIEVRHSGPRRAQRQHLMIRGRDETDLLDSVARQLAAVRDALAAHHYSADVLVSAAMCFIDARLPVCPVSVSGVPLLSARGTAKLVSSAGELDAADRARILAALAEGLPAAR